MYWTPNLVGDMRIRMTFDLYREPGAMSDRVAQYTGNAGWPVSVHRRRWTLALQNRRPQVCLPDSQWLLIGAGLGALADGTWSLKITGGVAALLGPGAVCDPEFNDALAGPEQRHGARCTDNV